MAIQDSDLFLVNRTTYPQTTVLIGPITNVTTIVGPGPTYSDGFRFIRESTGVRDPSAEYDGTTGKNQPSQVFNTDLTQTYYNRSPNSDFMVRFAPAAPIYCSTTLSVFIGTYAAKTDIIVNGVKIADVPESQPNSVKHDFPFTGFISSIELKFGPALVHWGAGDYICQVMAFYVDGIQLIDNASTTRLDFAPGTDLSGIRVGDSVKESDAAGTVLNAAGGVYSVDQAGHSIALMHQQPNWDVGSYVKGPTIDDLTKPKSFLSYQCRADQMAAKFGSNPSDIILFNRIDRNGNYRSYKATANILRQPLTVVQSSEIINVVDLGLTEPSQPQTGNRYEFEFTDDHDLSVFTVGETVTEELHTKPTTTTFYRLYTAPLDPAFLAAPADGPNWQFTDLTYVGQYNFQDQPSGLVAPAGTCWVMITDKRPSNVSTEHPLWTGFGFNDSVGLAKYTTNILAPNTPSGNLFVNTRSYYNGASDRSRVDQANIYFRTDGQPTEHSLRFVNASSENREQFRGIIESVNVANNKMICYSSMTAPQPGNSNKCLVQDQLISGSLGATDLLLVQRGGVSYKATGVDYNTYFPTQDFYYMSLHDTYSDMNNFLDGDANTYGSATPLVADNGVRVNFVNPMDRTGKTVTITVESSSWQILINGGWQQGPFTGKKSHVYPSTQGGNSLQSITIVPAGKDPVNFYRVDINNIPITIP